jgi:hypothetical protein
MIIGKHSALKGFGLFLYAIVTILVLICCGISTGYWWVAGVLNFITNSWVIFKLYTHFSNMNNN